jgi:hypothetical protein
MSGLRLIWGSTLLAAPQAVLDRMPAGDARPPVRALARVLGARHLIQVTMTLHHTTRSRLIIGAAVDASHAATMALLARWRPERRELALANAVAAAALAIAGVTAVRRSAGSVDRPKH